MKILAIGAHPDDIEIGCGGTLAKLIQDGHEVEYLIATDGEAGSNSITKTDLAQMRRVEAKAAAKVLGVDKIHFLELEDGLTSFERGHKIKMIELMRSIRPEIVFVHAKQDHFLDHEVIHRLTIAAIGAASGPWFQEVSGKPHAVKEIYGYEVWNPLNTWQLIVDISENFELKRKALAEHKSQVSAFDYLGALEGLARYRGAMSGSGKYAEAFEVILGKNLV